MSWLLLGAAVAAEPAPDWGLPEELPAWSAWVGDSDGDGRLELVTVAHKQWSWLEQDELGVFREADLKLSDKVDRHGMVGCDVDRDGRDELLIAVGGNRGAGGVPAELWQLGGQTPDELGLLGESAGARMRGATCSDLDGDGWPELWLPAMGRKWPDRLMERTEDGRWVDGAGAHGLAEPTTVLGGAWGDVDGDGDLDLVRLRERKAQVLLQTEGAFEALDPLPVEDVADLVLEDLDGDGDLDLYLATDGPRFDAAFDGHLRMKVGGGSWAEFLVPDGCGPVKVAIQGDVSGQPAEIVHATGSFKITGKIGQPELAEQKPDGRGIAIWRVEPRRLRLESARGKGYAQVGMRCKKSGAPLQLADAEIVHDASPPPLDRIFLNDDGIFRDSELPLPQVNSADVVPVDVDLDGDLDLFLVTALASGLEPNPPDLLLVNHGGAFAPQELDQTLAGVEGYLGLAADLDGDAYPELLAFNGEHYTPLAGTPTVWHNPGGDNGFVRVIARDGQAVALGARVQVSSSNGTTTRLSNPSPDWRSNGGTAQVFGIGQAGKAKVTVTWADGSSTTTRAKAGQTVVVQKR